jgi:asparagine synthase (glutamine-hydrolysing)
MCGVAGCFGPPSAAERLRAVGGAMAAALAHRGPDDGGVWADGAAGVVLAHRRLSVLDLSAEGRQPMASASGRFRIAFNGEVYNHGALRVELDRLGHAFRGRSDTEVALAAFEQWGVEAALGRFVGMFAFALWDGLDGTLWLARDRLGEKPLYYAWLGEALVFASELKALRVHPDWKQGLRRDALALFLRHGYVPAPHSIHEGVHKLPAGCLLAVCAPAADARPRFSPQVSPRAAPGAVAPRAWWSARESAWAGLRDPLRLPADEAVARLEARLGEAVALQRVADVPLGALLSGGVDSTTIVALMHAQGGASLATYTIGFREEGYDEADWARAIAGHLGTRHHELTVGAGDALATLPGLPRLYDEPISDPAQIPMLLLARLARGGVTVALSGDGGDELFGGYERYARAGRLWRTLGWMPRGARSAASRLLGRPGALALGGILARRAGADAAALPRLGKLARALGAADPAELHRCLVSHWPDPAALVHGAREPATAFDDASLRMPGADAVETMMLLDTVTWLADDVLVKVDRASMAVGLEVRAPFLDHRVFELAWRMPLAWKLRAGEGKWLLRRLLRRHLPARLVDRPKQGFEVPMGGWLRGVLRDWAESLLDERRLRQQGLLDPAPLRRLWSEHLSGACDWQWQLWNVLVLQAWLDAWGGA